MSDFAKFSKLVHERYTALSAGELFIVGERGGRAFSEAYLGAFPEGTNPVYKTSTEHDCTCCKNFVRNLGNVVALANGNMETVWDIEGAHYPYDVVAKTMAAFTRAHEISGLFRTKEGRYGLDYNMSMVDNSPKRWNHFHGHVSAKHRSGMPDTAIGCYKSCVDVFLRGLKELQPSALAIVLELIDSKSLYRGEEHLQAVKEFKVAQGVYNNLSASHRANFVWAYAGKPYARFRNTVIGTLVTDLSEGVDLEQAVCSFESKVAPTNYKRPTALITPSMVVNAMATIRALDLEPALERRFAHLDDVTVNNVLWADHAAVAKMKGGVEDLLMGATVSKGHATGKKVEMSIETFMRDVLPEAASIDMLVEGKHMNNFMSLTAPVNPEYRGMFKWSNQFGWSYDGNITDSIKEKVKAAGGNVTNAKLRVSLAWFNYDDLDIHVAEPSGNIICYHNKSGKLDVDMNAMRATTRKPVENVSWATTMNGIYDVAVNQFSQRETTDVGCVIEIENLGKLHQLSYPGTLKGMNRICSITVAHGVITSIEPAKGIVSGGISQEKWGLKTETFVKVNTLMHSPNHWDDNAVGNKHWFFILDKCKNPDTTRGVYNEFLQAGLEQHRKVFEILGDKTKCQPVNDQLSGLGFSSTRDDVVTVRVTTQSNTRLYSVNF